MRNHIKMITLTALMLAGAAIVSCSQGRAKTGDEEIFNIPYAPAKVSDSTLTSNPVWNSVKPENSLYAPWDGLDDNTDFRCFATDEDFCFRFIVNDSTMTYSEEIREELDIVHEDRVEIFFSPDIELKKYFCVEIDPLGRPLDNSASFYRQMDYEWNFSTMEIRHELTREGFAIAGKVTRKELAGLGIDFDKVFYIGVFRADFRKDGTVTWYSLKGTDDKNPDFHQPGVFFPAQIVKEGFFEQRGVVLSVEDLQSMDWPRLAHACGINTIGTHIHPNQVRDFIRSEAGRRFMDGCREYGIFVEHQLHAMGELLPRELFSEDSTMFRMDGNGIRQQQSNCCMHSEKALDIIAANAAQYAADLPATNHRYYFWLDDGAPTCQCPECAGYSASEQALIVENKIIEAIRKVDPKAMLAHLAYLNTLDAPVKVKPSEGIFLEFAPFNRRWDRPLEDRAAIGLHHALSHGELLDKLKENLRVFPAGTAEALEYWLDVSMVSDWKKPAKRLTWHPEVFASDLQTYASCGIRNITTFAVYMDSTYFSMFPCTDAVQEYGNGLSLLTAEGQEK